MSFLIQLRDRIKGIDTIKKITHAMRLISMSSRSRLKSKEEPLREYIQTATQLLTRIQPHAPHWQNPLINPNPDSPERHLIILIGSQRGLCGNFNTVLFRFFETIVPEKKSSLSFILVGKKAINYLENNRNYNIIKQFPDLHAKTITTISAEITHLVTKEEANFTTVSVISNKLKTFFVQKPHETILIPFTFDRSASHSTQLEEYYWEQSPEQLLDQLTYQLLEINIHYLLFQSLLAEHAARFISMDNATRNAQNLLEETQLQYNKLRQAKITKELTELVSNM